MSKLDCRAERFEAQDDAEAIGGGFGFIVGLGVGTYRSLEVGVARAIAEGFGAAVVVAAVIGVILGIADAAKSSREKID